MGIVDSDLSITLKMAAAETLENLAFTEVNPREDRQLTGPAERYHGCRISLGTLGEMHLVIGRDLLREIAVVLFNPPDGELPDETQVDTLNEVLNIIGGRFLEAVFKGQSDFALGLPEPNLDLEEWNGLPMRWVLVADGGMELAVGLGPSLAD